MMGCAAWFMAGLVTRLAVLVVVSGNSGLVGGSNSFGNSVGGKVEGEEEGKEFHYWCVRAM